MAVDATKPADDDFVVDWPAYIRLIAALANANEAAIGGDYSRTVSAQNTSTTLTTLDQVYTVNSASAVTLTLPEMVLANVGNWVRVHKLGAGNLTITAGGSDTIADGSAGTSIVNSTAAEDKAAFIEIECVAAGQWMICGMLGTWA
jgi:hypothetical protein